MVYQWKIPGLIPVEAQDAGEELDRIYRKNGQLSPQSVVEESRPITAPLHPCFEWDDTVAAEKYRQGQAQEIIRQIVVATEGGETQPASVRAFINKQQPRMGCPIYCTQSKKSCLDFEKRGDRNIRYMDERK